MANERSWEAISPVAFIADGQADGTITVSSVEGFKVKQGVVISATSLPTKKLEIKRVLSSTQMLVGPIVTTGKMLAREDMSVYTVALGATISADEQPKSKPTPNDIIAAVYEQEPTVGIRIMEVDYLGRPYSKNNPLPVDASVSVGDINIGTDGYDHTAPDSMNITGSEDGTKTGVKHSARVDSDLDLRVGLSNGANKAAIDTLGKLSVKDEDAQIILASIASIISGTVEVSDSAVANLVTISNTLLTAIQAQLTVGTMKVDDDQTQTILTSMLTQLQSGGIAVGTENGTLSGVPHVFVNNLRQMILASHDRVGNFTYLDIANKKNRRVDKVDYTSSTFPSITLRKQFSYTFVSNEYVPNGPGNWSLV